MNGDREIIGWKLVGGEEWRNLDFGKKFAIWKRGFEHFFFIFVKVAPTQRDLDLTSADAQTKSNTARYVTGFVTDFACPVFSKGHQPSMVLATPPLPSNSFSSGGIAKSLNGSRRNDSSFSREKKVGGKK